MQSEVPAAKSETSNTPELSIKGDVPCTPGSSQFVAFALAAFLTTTSSAYAETLKFQAKMDAAQEVPTNDSKGKGTADLTYDTDKQEFNLDDHL